MQINDVWHLGIDLGTTGLSAVLLNVSTTDLHPIYWQTATQHDSAKYSAQNPAVAYSGIVPNSDLAQSPFPSIVVGFLASSLARNHSGVFIQKFKPFLNMGIPYYSPHTHNWEPVLQWSSQQTVSLYWLRRVLQALLVTLKPSLDPVLAASVKVGAVGLDTETFHAALLSLSGIAMGSPAFWGDTYRFNLREALLGAGLVKYPEQIFFIDDAIATFLAELSDLELSRNIEDSKFSETNKFPEHPKFPIPNSQLKKGGTLVINAGASTTELALVDLPSNLQDLTHSDFILHSFPYGGSGLDQDIICQMLLRQGESDHQQGEVSLPLLDRLCLIDSNFELPLAGEPALVTRYRLQQKLHSTPLGLALLEAAQHLKRILQNQDEFILELGKKKYKCTAINLENRVISPFIKRLNQELNILLSQGQFSGKVINHVIFCGGSSALKQMQKWLKQKFSSATFISKNQNKESNIIPSFSMPIPSKVAYGLAILPLYPQVIERQEQQYSNYFLLLELCRAFPEQSLSVREIMQLLENRGINTRACHQRLIAILENQMPVNLVPSSLDAIWLTEASRQNLDYQSVVAAPLFYKEGNQHYRINSQQCKRLWKYFDTILSGTYQKLEEPMLINLGQ